MGDAKGSSHGTMDAAHRAPMARRSGHAGASRNVPRAKESIIRSPALLAWAFAVAILPVVLYVAVWGLPQVGDTCRSSLPYLGMFLGPLALFDLLWVCGAFFRPVLPRLRGTAASWSVLATVVSLSCVGAFCTMTFGHIGGGLWCPVLAGLMLVFVAPFVTNLVLATTRGRMGLSGAVAVTVIGVIVLSVIPTTVSFAVGMVQYVGVEMVPWSDDSAMAGHGLARQTPREVTEDLDARGLVYSYDGRSLTGIADRNNHYLYGVYPSGAETGILTRLSALVPSDGFSVLLEDGTVYPAYVYYAYDSLLDVTPGTDALVIRWKIVYCGGHVCAIPERPQGLADIGSGIPFGVVYAEDDSLVTYHGDAGGYSLDGGVVGYDSCRRLGWTEVVPLDWEPDTRLMPDVQATVVGGCFRVEHVDRIDAQTLDAVAEDLAGKKMTDAARAAASRRKELLDVRGTDGNDLAGRDDDRGTQETGEAE